MKRVKFASVNSTGLPEKSGALHLPHLAALAGLSSGTRFIAVQAGQVIWLDMVYCLGKSIKLYSINRKWICLGKVTG